MSDSRLDNLPYNKTIDNYYTMYTELVSN